MTLQSWLTDRYTVIYNYLNWGSALVDPLLGIIDDTLELYGVATEAEATDEKKLHAIAKYKLWERVLNDVAADYKFSADNASFDRNQVYEQAKKELELAAKEAKHYLSGKVVIGRVADFAGVHIHRHYPWSW